MLKPTRWALLCLLSSNNSKKNKLLITGSDACSSGTESLWALLQWNVVMLALIPKSQHNHMHGCIILMKRQRCHHSNGTEISCLCTNLISPFRATTLRRSCRPTHLSSSIPSSYLSGPTVHFTEALRKMKLYRYLHTRYWQDWWLQLCEFMHIQEICNNYTKCMQITTFVFWPGKPICLRQFVKVDAVSNWAAFSPSTIAEK